MVENGTRVSAYNTKSFVFLSEMSVGDPSVDNITTVNIPAWVSHELQVQWASKRGKGEVRFSPSTLRPKLDLSGKTVLFFSVCL